MQVINIGSTRSSEYTITVGAESYRAYAHSVRSAIESLTDYLPETETTFNKFLADSEGYYHRMVSIGMQGEIVAEYEVCVDVSYPQR